MDVEGMCGMLYGPTPDRLKPLSTSDGAGEGCNATQATVFGQTGSVPVDAGY